MEPSGRDLKETSKSKFVFAVQSNVVCGGGGGVNRLTVVPKHIKTGGNFGLTNLIMALWSAHKSGRLADQNSPGLYRHTDGGPDNVTFTTHLFHWLLVWLGVFQNIIWFRFDAGHSHTEIADRLFSMMKKLFATDSQARPTPIQSFPELVAKLEATFKNCRERTEISYLFANWDFNDWFQRCSLTCDKNFGGISFDNVFKYEYVGRSHWFHGGVKVTYKNRLSYVPENANEAEWAPIERVDARTESGSSATAASASAATSAPRNVTTDAGVHFVGAPPDLRSEPLREDYAAPKSDKSPTPSAVCSSLVQKRKGHPEELSADSAAHWEALGSIFAKHPHPASMPEMPIHEGNFEFDGCPLKLLPILRGLRRFPRPLITWDPFKDAPPQAWPDPAHAAGGAAAASTASGDSTDPHGGSTLRDPRQVNSVSHAGYSEAEKKRDTKDLNARVWAMDLDMPVDSVQEGRLYLVQLPTPEGEFKLGLAEAGTAADDQTTAAKWFEKTGDKHYWGIHPAFKPYIRQEKRVVDPVRNDCFLVEIREDYLVDAKSMETSPQLDAAFMKKLRALAEIVPELKGPPYKRRKSASAQDAPAAAPGPQPASRNPKPAGPQKKEKKKSASSEKESAGSGASTHKRKSPSADGADAQGEKRQRPAPSKKGQKPAPQGAAHDNPNPTRASRSRAAQPAQPETS